MNKSLPALILPCFLLLGCSLLLSSCSTHEEIEIVATVTSAPEDVFEDEEVHEEDAAPNLLDPSTCSATAPATYKVKLETTKGDVIIDVHREWAPLGADRFYNLVKVGFFDDVAFFRAIGGFMAQFGINGDPKVNTAWQPARIKDDPVVQSNTRGRLTFAMGGPNTRTTQMFINFGNNASLDGMGFPPLGEVTSGMDIIDSLYTGYGDGPPQGRGPNQQQLQMSGNEYLKADFPKLDYIKRASIIE